MSFKVTWLGQGGYILGQGDEQIMIDPYLSDSVERIEGHKRQVPLPCDPGTVAPVLVLCTHDHLDHCDPDTIKLMLAGEAGKKGSKFAGPERVQSLLAKLGVPEDNIISFNRGDTMEVCGYKITAIFAQHTPDSIGFLVEKDGISAMFTGDSLFTDEVGKGITCDVLFTCINGKLGNMTADEAVRLTSRVRALVGVPAHYDMFANNMEDPAAYLDHISCAGYKAVPGQAFDLADFDLTR